MSELICVGSIAGAFGVKGELRVKSFCANPSDLAKYTPLLTEDGEKSFELSLIGEIKNGFSARIVGIDTKEAADALRGVSLFARREDLPELPVDEYYYSDLIGFEVADTGGIFIGTVKTVVNHGADDLLEISIPGASDTALVPFTKIFVPTVDMNAKKIVIDPPEGLL
ncbi:MAG: ribosome maturation factor RimM, partial [Planktomarina sp.]|jgi:16S rRNA processing protein RimM|nr:ribosome maturation factor RimM [Planktomarina sp.]MDS9945982.1 ribosome maturation factor RimM [Planktomarina sp.]|tara:strand:- start:1606 stop:2109 length:504 start_codon:yes stop_codon:yes gene_type:complete